MPPHRQAPRRPRGTSPRPWRNSPRAETRAWFPRPQGGRDPRTANRIGYRRHDERVDESVVGLDIGPGLVTHLGHHSGHPRRSRQRPQVSPRPAHTAHSNGTAGQCPGTAPGLGTAHPGSGPPSRRRQPASANPDRGRCGGLQGSCKATRAAFFQPRRGRNDEESHAVGVRAGRGRRARGNWDSCRG